MGVSYFAPYIPSPEGRGFTAHWITKIRVKMRVKI